jgi:hypothetical protein
VALVVSSVSLAVRNAQNSWEHRYAELRVPGLSEVLRASCGLMAIYDPSSRTSWCLPAGTTTVQTGGRLDNVDRVPETAIRSDVPAGHPTRSALKHHPLYPPTRPLFVHRT